MLYCCFCEVLFIHPADLFFWEAIPPHQVLLFSLLQAKENIILSREVPPKHDYFNDFWVGLGLHMPAHFGLLCQRPLTVSYIPSFFAKSPSRRGSSLQAALLALASGGCVSEPDATAPPIRPQFSRDAATDSTPVSSALERNV